MKIVLFVLVVLRQGLPSSALLRGDSPHKKAQLLAEQHEVEGANPVRGQAKKQWRELTEHNQQPRLLASEPPSIKKEKKRMDIAQKQTSISEMRPIKGCLACFGEQVVYGKYRTEDGDQTDNSYYLFKSPDHSELNESLPIIIQFHSGGFFSGAPWRRENKEIHAYLRKGFAVVSVGYRLTAQKYYFEAEDGSNKTEELIHVSNDGKLSLDTSGKTMDDYQVRVGEQEFITKYLYDATRMIDNLVDNAEKLGLDVNRIVFAGESSGGAGMQYLSWVFHKWNIDRFTPRGMVFNNAQLNYPVHNMLGETWDLFAETMGPKTKLSDVVSEEACPTVIGNHMCHSALGNSSDYVLCNEKWNEKALSQFCGEARKGRTLEQVRAHQVWLREDKEVGKGMEKLWYASENMQKHLPSDPFYIYAANSMNGTSAVDLAHHSIFALNFAKYAEMGKHGGHQYTVYYTDFAHMTEADRGMQRLEGKSTSLELPPDAGAVQGPAAVAGRSPSAAVAPAPAPAAAPAPAPGPEPEYPVAGKVVFNYLSTHGWREDFADKVEAGSLEERVLYACMAAGVGPFGALPNETETADRKSESGTLGSSLSSLVVASLSLLALLSSSH